MVVDTKVANKVSNGANSEGEDSRVKTRQLRANPFITYRDPDTGRWIVIKTVAA